jgi:hypothetical protein
MLPSASDLASFVACYIILTDGLLAYLQDPPVDDGPSALGWSTN